MPPQSWPFSIEKKKWFNSLGYSGCKLRPFLQSRLSALRNERFKQQTLSMASPRFEPPQLSLEWLLVLLNCHSILLSAFDIQRK